MTIMAILRSLFTVSSAVTSNSIRYGCTNSVHAPVMRTGMSIHAFALQHVHQHEGVDALIHKITELDALLRDVLNIQECPMD